MLDLTFTNANGDSMLLGSAFPYVINSVTGLWTKEVTLQAPKGYSQHGTYYYGSIDSARVINLTIAFKGDTIAEIREIEREIASIFNPRLGLGVLKIDTGDEVYKIDAAVAVAPDPYKVEDGIYVYRQFDVVLYCPKPDLLSYTPYSIKMKTFIGGLTFPAEFGITFAELGTGGAIDYTGDNPADIIFDFRVTTGGTSMTNPKVTNQNGDYIEIDKVILEGERVVVDTNPDAPTVTLVAIDGTESDGWEYLVWGSTFFELETGVNTFDFSADAGDPEVYASYRIHYS